MTSLKPNTDECRAFAADLRTRKDSIKDMLRQIRSRMYAVNAGLKDAENEKFMEEFELHAAAADRIAGYMDRYGTFIDKRCDLWEEYTNTGL